MKACFRRAAGSQDGMVLVLVLMILALITAMVTEFSYGVYTATAALHNWKESQRLSFVCRSGLSLAVRALNEAQRLSDYTYPGRLDLPVQGVAEGFEGSLTLTVEDETSRFNLNAIANDKALAAFKRLVDALELDSAIALRVLDWIDSNGDPELRDSEEGAKNGRLDTPDELLLIRGIDKKSFEKLSSYITTFGKSDQVGININTASLPVIMSLDVGRDDAEKIVKEREKRPFSGDDINTRVVPIAPVLKGKVGMKSSYFRITALAEENKIRRMIECVVQLDGAGQAKVLYWRET